MENYGRLKHAEINDRINIKVRAEQRFSRLTLRGNEGVAITKET
jgi:hypothetical protein